MLSYLGVLFQNSVNSSRMCVIVRGVHIRFGTARMSRVCKVFRGHIFTPHVLDCLFGFALVLCPFTFAFAQVADVTADEFVL